MQTEQHSESCPKSATQLLLLLLCTSTLVTLFGSILSQSAVATIAASKVYGVVLVLILSASLLWRATKSLEVSILVLTAYLGLVLWLRSGWLLVPLVIAATAFLASVGVRGIPRFLRGSGLWIRSGIAAGLVLSVTHYGDFLIIEKLRQGNIPQDTLFHASIASMIKTYGVVSTGLHGVVELPYHVLSHRLFATLSILSGVHVLETYGILQIIFLCPLLIAAITWCTFKLSHAESGEDVNQCWLIVCAVLILLKVLPLERGAFGDSYFVSESYTLSLVFLMLALPVVVSPRTELGAAIIAGALILLAGLSKGSVGIFGLSLLWVRTVWCPGFIGRGRIAAVAVVTTAAFVCLMFAPAQQASMGTSFNPFYVAQVHSVWGAELRDALEGLAVGRVLEVTILIKALVAISLFLISNYILSLTVVLRRFLVGGAKAVITEPDSLYSLAAVGVSAPALLFQFVGGTWYFINPTMFVALPFVAIGLCARLRRMSALVSASLVAAAVLGVTTSLVGGYNERTGVFRKSHKSLHEEWIDVTDNTRLLLELRDKYTNRSVVFERGEAFPKPNSKSKWHYAQVPFLYPAVTERSWIGVIDLGSDRKYEYYGYQQYLPPPFHHLVPPVIPPNAQIVRISGP